MDRFVLITKGPQDSSDKGIIRLPPNCYDRVFELKQKTGMPMGRILEQCVDFALDHLSCGEYEKEANIRCQHQNSTPRCQPHPRTAG